MNIDQKKGAPALAAALALALVVSTGAAPEPAPQPSPRVNRFLGGRAAEVLARADRAQAFRLTGERAKEDERAVGWYRIQSAGREQDGAFARKVAGALLDEKSYRFDERRRGGFKPLVGWRLWDGEIKKINPNSPSRFIVSCTAFAEGATHQPSASSAARVAVSIASISGTITSGLCFSTALRSALPSSIGNISNPSATCIAGALA